ncbi:MAG: sigma-70 family RNA polymerase sigma factor [Maribacter sp.]
MEKSPAVFQSIYTSNYPKVMRLCLGHVNGDEAMAQELAQETFIKVWENLSSFREEAQVATWVYRITVNTCLLHFRRKKRENTVELSQQLAQPEAEDHLTKQDQITQLYACIDTLRSEQKSIILLELEGIPQKEIAEVMGLTHEAVRVRIHRIKNALTNCVQHENI